jgi:hypothetical protein
MIRSVIAVKSFDVSEWKQGVLGAKPPSRSWWFCRTVLLSRLNLSCILYPDKNTFQGQVHFQRTRNDIFQVAKCGYTCFKKTLDSYDRPNHIISVSETSKTLDSSDRPNHIISVSRKVWRYQRGNQSHNLKKHRLLWPKEKGQKDFSFLIQMTKDMLCMW